MPRFLGSFAVSVLLASCLASTASAANHTVQAMPGNVFVPANLTVEVGDTVTFVNAGGVHNVRATDGSFRCAEGCDGEGGSGDPSKADWSFTRTFDQEGQVGYVCEPHEGFGMAGTITVERGIDVPGNLRLGAAALSRSEGSGVFVVEIQRVGGDDGAVTVDYATSDGSAVAGMDYTAASGTLTWPDNDDDPRVVVVLIQDDAESEGSESFTFMLSSPGGGAGLAAPSAATLTITDDDVGDQPGTLGFAAGTISASEGAGSVDVQVVRTGGDDGAVSVDYATSDGSAAAGADYVGTSGTLSWANGDSAPKTFSVQILDDGAEEGPETVNLSLSNVSGGASLGTAAATLTVEDDETVGACTADGDTLCLGAGGRFRAEITWQTSTGPATPGNAVDIGRRDSGLFYFFDENNIEMLLKLLDGCGVNNRFWVFYAATTDVEFELTVTDTVTGQEKVYTNPLDNPAPPVLDTDAFAVCP